MGNAIIVKIGYRCYQLRTLPGDLLVSERTSLKKIKERATELCYTPQTKVKVIA